MGHRLESGGRTLGYENSLRRPTVLESMLPIRFGQSQMDTIPPYWLARKSDWQDEKKKKTEIWADAAFVYEEGEYVRITKPGESLLDLLKRTVQY